MNYTAIAEWCDNEGEKWINFVPTLGNEEFIKTLKELGEKYYGEDELEISGNINVYDKQYTETEVDFLVETENLFQINGYDSLFQKTDKLLDINLLKVNNVEEFVNSFYKGKLFK